MRVDESELALVCDRRRFSGVIITRDDQYTSVCARAGGVAVLQRIARPVEARPLPVPQGEDAVLVGPRRGPEHLRAPYRGGGEFLVHPGLEDDIVPLQVRAGPPELDVDGPERGSPVARDVTGRVQAGSAVPVALRQRQADDRLHTGHQRFAGAKCVLVV